MTIRFVAEAQHELLDAMSYYEEARIGLGQRFKDEVDRSIPWIADHPEICRLRRGGYRRIDLRVFPYSIPYVVRHETLWVLAVAHGSRKPAYWISRRGEVLGPALNNDTASEQSTGLRQRPCTPCGAHL